MTETNEAVVLSKEICQEIDKWIAKYPVGQERSAVFEALRLVQEHHNNALTTPLMDAVADYLKIPAIAVYEVASFYTMYNLSPTGKHVIEVCSNISCMLNGSQKIIQHLKARLGIDVNETTADGKFTLKEVECLGACVAPPVCQIGKKYHENLTAEKVDEIIAALS